MHGRRCVTGILTLALMMATLLPGRLQAAEVPFSIAYTVTLVQEDHPAVDMAVTGASGIITRLEFRSGLLNLISDLTTVFTGLRATDPLGNALPVAWENRGITVRNGAHKEFTVHYEVDALKIGTRHEGEKGLLFRKGYLFFVAGDLFLLPVTEPGGITVQFRVPDGTRVYSSLPERDGGFVATTALWGGLLDDFPLAYFSGGAPRFAVSRTTAWGDTYQYVWFDRDSEIWFPSYGMTPWEHAARYLALSEEIARYLREKVMGPLPPHKVLFTYNKIPGGEIAGVGTNTDWFYYQQIYRWDDLPEMVHHMLHQWTFHGSNTKLPLVGDSPLHQMLNEGLNMFFEMTVPSAITGDPSYQGKLFEFYVLEERGRPLGIAASSFHQNYNRAAMRVFLLDRYIRRETGGARDLTDFTRTLWDSVKDRQAPGSVSEDEIRRAFARVVPAGKEGFIDQVASRSDFTWADFNPLLPEFGAYVDRWAGEYFWSNRLLFLALLDIMAGRGEEWPHYTTYPHMIKRYGYEGLRPFKAALAARGHEAVTRDDVVAALQAATGKDHSGFFEFWAQQGFDLDPASLLPLDGWGLEALGEEQLTVSGNQAVGTLVTEHYVSGLPQQAAAVLDRPAPSDEILIQVSAQSFEGVRPASEVRGALAGDNVQLRNEMSFPYRGLNFTRAYFIVKTTDPERRRFPFTLTLPPFGAHVSLRAFGVNAGGENVELGDLYFLHAFNPFPVQATADETGLHLGQTVLPGARFHVDLGGRVLQVVNPGETIELGSSTPQQIRVDLIDEHGFLRGRTVVPRP
ncbi:MAG TPA: hypothetical protein VD969_12460 [Symbiobacteriaceae bacterium]|nr:hypothetical protein [Symbiobacteriaceae bacterium]